MPRPLGNDVFKMLILAQILIFAVIPVIGKLVSGSEVMMAWKENARVSEIVECCHMAAVSKEERDASADKVDHLLDTFSDEGVGIICELQIAGA